LTPTIPTLKPPRYEPHQTKEELEALFHRGKVREYTGEKSQPEPVRDKYYHNPGGLIFDVLNRMYGRGHFENEDL